MGDFVKIKKKEDLNLAVIYIDNPPANALSEGVFRELAQILSELKNDEKIKVVAITGAGNTFFIAGADIRDLMKMTTPEGAKQIVDSGQEIINLIESLGKPVIALINGWCLGGGNELSMACTYRIAGENAVFGQPEIKLGIIPGLGGTQRLPRLVGLKEATKLLLSGEQIKAQKAKEIGLVDEVFKPEELLGKFKELVAEILKNPCAVATKYSRKKLDFNLAEIDEVLAEFEKDPKFDEAPLLAINDTVKALKEGVNLPLVDALKLEAGLFANLAITPDAKEGMKAFFEKRTPNFKNVRKPQKVEEKPKEEKPAEKKVVASAGFTEEHEMLRELLKDFVKNELPFKKVKEMEKNENIPRELLNQMAGLGFFGIPYPEKYGGSNLGKIGYAILFEELARADGGLAAVVGVHAGLSTLPIFNFGTEEQKQKYLVSAIRGEKIGAFGLTEGEAGSDVANIKTMAKKEGNKWIINGTKQFITNGDIADFVILFAQTDKYAGNKGITAFIIETSWPGFSTGKVEDKIGVRTSRTVELAFENLEMPEENLLGKVGQGFKIAMNTLNSGRLGLAAGCVGTSKKALELAKKYSAERKQGGRPLYEYQMIQMYLGRMRAWIYLMESSVYRAAEKADKGGDIREEAAILKLMCSELSSWVIDRALQVHGGYGYTEDYPIAKMWRDARINWIWEGTNEIQTLMIVKEMGKDLLPK